MEEKRWHLFFIRVILVMAVAALFVFLSLPFISSRIIGWMLFGEAILFVMNIACWWTWVSTKPERKVTWINDILVELKKQKAEQDKENEPAYREALVLVAVFVFILVVSCCYTFLP